jgi:hypothetical protein
VYVGQLSGAAIVWKWVGGMMIAARVNYPSDLGLNDVGFELYINDYSHLAVWDGAGWRLTDGGGGYFVDSAIALGTGYQLCDGTTTDYILNNTTNLALQSFTTPDLKTVSVGTYFKSAAAYTGTTGGPTAPVISGNTADESAHTHDVTITNNAAAVNAGPNDISANQTVTSTGGTAHHHAVGTLVNDTTGEPLNMGTLKYFRR